MRKNIDEMTMGEIRAYVRELEEGRGAAKRSCSCGDRRREITEPADETFTARTGCLCCGMWDGPVVLK